VDVSNEADKKDTNKMNANKANALAAFLTTIVRPMISGCVPLALIDKPAPGTGASKLLDLISIVATGSQWRPLVRRTMRKSGASR
jgi:hypothetical protein